MDRTLYNLIIPRDSQTQTNSQRQANIATQALLDEDTSAVDALSLDANERRLEATLSGVYAEKRARELEGLFGASGFDKVAYYAPNRDDADGYYVLEEGSFERASELEGRVQRIEGTLRRAGTRGSNLRELAISPSLTDYPGANTESCLVGVPAAASRVQWYHPETEETEGATPVETREGQMDSITVYDAAPGVVPFSGASLVYDTPYGSTSGVSCLVWDSRGHSSRTDSDDVVQWRRVYRTDHDYVGAPILDNGLVRARLDTQNGIQAEEWDPDTGAWTTVSLPSTGWSLQSVDVRSLSPVRTQVRLIFTNGGEEYPLDAVLHRGRERLQLDRPRDAPVPSGLETRLSGLDDGSVYDSGSGLGLRDRGEVSE